MPLQILTRPMPPKRFPNTRLVDELQPGLPPDPAPSCHAAIDVELEPAPSVLRHTMDPPIAMKKTTAAAEAMALTGDEDHGEPGTILLESASRTISRSVL